MIRKLSFFTLGLGIAWSGSAMAQMTCPAPPQQIEKNVYSDGKAKIGAIGPIKAGDFEGKLDVIATDFLHDYPSADKLGVAQLFLSVTCETIKGDKTLSYEQKEHMLESTRSDIVKVFLGSSTAAAIAPSPAPLKPKWLTASLKVNGCGHSGCYANHDVCLDIEDGWTATGQTRNWSDSFGGAYGDWEGNVRFEPTRVCRTFRQHSHNVDRDVSFQFEVAPPK